MLFHTYSRRIAAFLAIVGMIMTNACTAVDQQPESNFSMLADWGYILRGALFIFASALAMVWIGRKISGRRK
jgi:hypothetical protein